MALVLNEEQRLLRDTARDFLADNAPVSQLRKLRDERDDTGYSEELWSRMAEMGWASIILPEEYGGLDFGFTGLGVVLEEAGRNLSASPLFSAAVVGASCVLLGGSNQQKDQILPQIAGGKLTLTLALEESRHHSPSRISARAAPQGENYLISGKKTFVLDGHVADKWIVVARTSGDTDSTGGISLFLVDRDAPGTRCQRNIMVDSRNSATIEFSEVLVSPEQLIGAPGEGWPILEQVLDRGRIAMAAEMLGCALEAFERTVEYLKERVQFDVAIGSFQALQHRAAHIQSELELSRSVVLQALCSVDEAPEQLPLLASLAKANLNELVKLVSNEAIQMHGGIGVTDEFDIGLYLKRARVAMQIFGDTGYHKNRYASLCSY
jgi:alkylation response protein AidB-like acyl-CoA dehydrogenase